MEVHLRRPLPKESHAAIARELRSIDPATVVDVDPINGVLRINTRVDGASLLRNITRIEPTVTETDLRYIPSTCCGGCGG